MANKPFFTPRNDIKLFDAINEELIDELVGQTVDIYKVNLDDTESNLYGESTSKTFDVGFRVNCLIDLFKWVFYLWFFYNAVCI